MKNDVVCTESDGLYMYIVEKHSSNILAGPPVAFWSEITLKTQRVVDAVHKSWQIDGAKVEVEPMVPKL